MADFSSLMEPIGLGNPSRDIRLFALEEPLKIIDELEFQRFKSEPFDFKRFQLNLYDKKLKVFNLNSILIDSNLN